MWGATHMGSWWSMSDCYGICYNYLRFVNRSIFVGRLQYAECVSTPTWRVTNVQLSTRVPCAKPIEIMERHLKREEGEMMTIYKSNERDVRGGKWRKRGEKRGKRKRGWREGLKSCSISLLSVLDLPSYVSRDVTWLISLQMERRYINLSPLSYLATLSPAGFFIHHFIISQGPYSTCAMHTGLATMYVAHPYFSCYSCVAW